MIMQKTEQDQIRAILVQAIANICRKGLTYRKNFSIEGLLGITLDDEEIFLLNIKETVHHAGYLISSSRSKSTTPNASAKPTTLSLTERLQLAAVPAVRRGKRRATIGGSLPEPSVKIPANQSTEEISTKPEPEALNEDKEAVGTNGSVEELSNGQQAGRSIVIKPVKKRSLWGRSRRAKPRKSVPVRAVPTEPSQPVFPEQDATDLGHFLSMKPMLRDIDETESTASGDQKDDESNGSGGSLRIDTGSNEGGGGGRGSDDGKGDGFSHPEVYIDHCVDGELSDVLNLTGDSEADTSHGSAAGVVYNGEEGYQCGLCDEVFDDQITCRRHMRHQHKAKVSYTCELCGRRFWHHGDYTEHKAVFHEGPGGYPCEHCGKVLLSKRGLKEHTQHHTGEFPYFCINCNRGFGRKFEYTGHMRKHHPDEFQLLESS